MFKLILITYSFFPQDSLQRDTIVPPSIMLIKKNENNTIKTLKYQHQQGFFCDFEDKISKNKKVFINLGVGDQ